jgi:hypothetical protein
VDFLDVGGADAASRHPDEQFMGADGGYRQRLDAEVSWRTIDNRFHLFRNREHGYLIVEIWKSGNQEIRRWSAGILVHCSLRTESEADENVGARGDGVAEAKSGLDPEA